MTLLPPETSSALTKIAAQAWERATDGLQTTANAVFVATLVVLEDLLRLVHAGAANEIGCLRENLRRRDGARTDSTEAEAEERKARAIDAANKASMHKRKDALARIEHDERRLRNARTQAEVEQIRGEIANKRMLARAEAFDKLVDAISRLRQEGGDFLIDAEYLQRMLGSLSDAADDLEDLPE